MGIVVKRENRKDISELKKIGEKHFEQRLAYENQLIEAYNSKKLKSEKLIAEAQNVIKSREKKTAEKKNTKYFIKQGKLIYLAFYIYSYK